MTQGGEKPRLLGARAGPCRRVGGAARWRGLVAAAAAAAACPPVPGGAALGLGHSSPPPPVPQTPQLYPQTLPSSLPHFRLGCGWIRNSLGTAAIIPKRRRLQLAGAGQGQVCMLGPSSLMH